MADVPLPRPGPLGLIQYAGVDMHAYAAAVSAAKDAEISRLKHRIALHDPCNGRMAGEPPHYTPECVVFRAEIAQLRADAIDRQNNVVAPLRARVRVLEDALRNDEQFLVDLEKAMGPFALPSGRTCTQLAAVRTALERKP